MKTVNNLYQQIYNFSNLHKAYQKARLNKRYKQDVLMFSANLEEELINLQNHLIYKSYIPGKYHQFFVHDPKTRLILALPFRDRVIHQALCGIINPIFEPTFIYDSYACRVGKGTLAGVDRVKGFLDKEKSKHDKVYCLKMDVTKYFYSIDHNILKRLIRSKIRCKNTLWLIDLIIDSTDDEIGIPVGNLTSQLFANIYLNKLDHFIKEQLLMKHYVRYMDDMIILHHDKRILWSALKEVKEFLFEYKLRLNNKTAVFDVCAGIDFLGYRQFLNRRILRKRIMQKNYRKFNKYIKSNKDDAHINRSLQSLKGQCKHCDGTKILEKIKTIIGEVRWERMYSN